MRKWSAGLGLLFLLAGGRAHADRVTVDQQLGLSNISASVTAPAGSYTCQTFFHDSTDNTWPQLNASGPVTAPNVSFSASGLPVGHMDAVRLLLFNPGSWTPVYDQTFPIDVDVTTTQAPITSPTYFIGQPYQGSDNLEHYPVTLKFPANYQQPLYNGVWVMIKGDSFFNQVWVDLGAAKAGTDPLDPYLRLDTEVTTAVPPAGVHYAQGGAFTYWWSAWSNWVWPGSLFESGGNSWIMRCPAGKRPLLSSAFRKYGKSPFAIGGDLGNYSAVGTYGSYNNYADPVYLGALRAMGIRWLRENISSDLYLNEQVYRDIIRSHVEAMWLAGICPVLAFQDEPVAPTREQRDALLVQADAMLAADYAPVPNNIILEDCNEPHAHPAWSNDWKPVAIECLQAMRQADPDGHFWTSCEAWSSSAAAAEKDPLPTDLTTSYDVHLYSGADSVAAAVGKGLRVVVGEYHDASAAFHQALLSHGNINAIGAWSWSLPGQDYLALVVSQNGSQLTLSSDGAAISQAYQQIVAGQPITAPVTSPSN